MRMFLRRSMVGRDPLPVAMTGVRMGERVLQVGIDDPQLGGALAVKVGLSGHAAFVVSDERAAQKALAAAAKAGALVDVKVSSLESLPFPERAFDLVVVNSMGGLLAVLAPAVRANVLRELHRVLRAGGRVVTIESGTRSGFATAGRAFTAHLARRKAAPYLSRDSEFEKRGGAVAALQAAGFTPVRPLGDREGYRFTEGLKSGT